MTSIDLDTQRSRAGDTGAWVKWLARFGMFCSGILWILVGVATYVYFRVRDPRRLDAAGSVLASDEESSPAHVAESARDE